MGDTIIVPLFFPVQNLNHKINLTNLIQTIVV